MQALTAAGCENKLARDICFAAGQRMAMADDAWGPAGKALTNYKLGKWDVPGPDFAVQLCIETFGDPPDTKKAAEWLRERFKI